MNDARPTLSNGMLLVLIPLFGYLAAFAYNRAYVQVFGIPPELISFDVNTLIVTGGNVWDIISSVGLSIALVWLLGRQQPRNPLVYRLSLVMPSVTFALLFEQLRYPLWARFFVYLFVAIFVYFDLLDPLVKYRHVTGYLNKLQTADDSKDNLIVVENKYFVPVQIAILVFVLLFFSGAAGRRNALDMHRFLVLPDHPDMIVPAVYTDKVIAVRVDRKSRKVLPEIVVITRESGKPLVLRWEEVGTLSPALER